MVGTSYSEGIKMHQYRPCLLRVNKKKRKYRSNTSLARAILLVVQVTEAIGPDVVLPIIFFHLLFIFFYIKSISCSVFFFSVNY
jgi:hypothetical protein